MKKVRAIPSLLACVIAGATALHLFANNKYHEKYVTIVSSYYKGDWNCLSRLQGRGDLRAGTWNKIKIGSSMDERGARKKTGEMVGEEGQICQIYFPVCLV